MNKETLRGNLYSTAVELKEWFKHTLEIREERSTSDIKKITQSILNQAIEDGITEEEYHFIWSIFEDDAIHWADNPELLHSHIKLDITPKLTPPECSLGIGLLIADKASEYLKSNSHKQHLLSTLLLIAATDARGHWMALRGITQCRNPVKKFVAAETNIKNAESEIILKRRLSKQGKKNVNSRHNQPGGSRDKRQKVVGAWLTGRYKTKTECIDTVCGKIGISIHTGQKALRGIPHPNETTSP